MKLAIGSVQFGVDYGAFNKSGQVHTDEVKAILQCALESGVDVIDTARVYGAAEQVLCDTGIAARFRIITKCPSLKSSVAPEYDLRKHFDESCAALGVDQVYGYMLHDANDLNRESALRIWSSMEYLRAEGKVERIGVSAYGIEEAQELSKSFALSLVQLPGNVLVPWYDEIRLPPSVEVHVRSVFLQGFLLSEPAALNGFFKPWRKTLETFRARASLLGLTPLEAALVPLLKSNQVDRVVLGVDSLEQLEKVVQAAKVAKEVGGVSLGDFPEVTAALTDPRNWH